MSKYDNLGNTDVIDYHEAAVAYTKDSTSPYLGQKGWGYTFECTTSNLVAMQAALDGFDLEAWRIRAGLIHSAPMASPVITRTVADVTGEKLAKALCRLAGHRVYTRDPKRLEGWRTEGAAANRTIDRPMPENPNQDDEGMVWVGDGLAVFVLLVESARQGPRWCVVSAQQRTYPVKTPAQVIRFHRAHPARGARQGAKPIFCYDAQERLIETWPEHQADLARAAALQWRTEMQDSVATARDGYATEVPVAPEVLYRAAIADGDGGTTTWRAILSAGAED